MQIESGEVLELNELRRAAKPVRLPSARICIDSGSIGDVVDDVVIKTAATPQRRRHRASIIAINSCWRSRGDSGDCGRGFAGVDAGQ